MCELFLKDNVGKTMEKKGYFLFSGPHFSFCCKLVSVIDPVASLTRLAFGRPTLFGFISAACSFFEFTTPVDVFFAGGGAEQAVD